jgi:hypothetical protein
VNQLWIKERNNDALGHIPSVAKVTSKKELQKIKDDIDYI